MATIDRAYIVSPTSDYISKISECEKELIAVMGIEKFRQMGLDDSVHLCKRLVAHASKYANNEQKVQIKAIFPDNVGLDSMAQACVKMRQIVNLNVYPDSQEAVGYVKELEESILDMIEEPLDLSRTLTCQMAVDRVDLEMLKRLKKLNRGWNQELIQYAQEKLDKLLTLSKEASEEKYKKALDAEVKKAVDILEWIKEEFKGSEEKAAP